jgi:hypothetical protein
LDGDGKYLDLQKGNYFVAFRVRLPIKADAYQLDVSLNEGNGVQVDRWRATPRLVVLPKLATSLSAKWHGLLNEEVKFEITREGCGE